MKLDKSCTTTAYNDKNRTSSDNNDDCRSSIK